MNLQSLINALPGARVTGNTSLEITGITHDSRTVRPGDCFLALPGVHTEGSAFSNEAFKKGALAVLASTPAPSTLSPQHAWIEVPNPLEAAAKLAATFFGNPTHNLTVIGVTGTHGKTTTAFFIDSLFRAHGARTGLLGTVEYRIGSRVIPSSHTTPLASELQKLFFDMRNDTVTHVAMEVSSHALSLARVEAVAWDGAVFTGLARDHLDFHRTIPEYFEAKKLFFTRYLPASPKEHKFAVVLGDDPYGMKIPSDPSYRLLRYGFGDHVDIRAREITTTLEGSEFTLTAPWGETRVHLNLFSEFNILNALAAASVGTALEMPPEIIVRGLQDMVPVPGRLEKVPSSQPFLTVVDYAHTDGSLESVLNALTKLPHKRIITVFGCGGDRDRTKRPAMGEVATRLSDISVITSDNPRSESPQAIMQEIEAGIQAHGRKNYVMIEDRAEAIRYAIEHAEPEDIVLIAGKGHEKTQLIGSRTLPFDDVAVARTYLNK